MEFRFSSLFEHDLFGLPSPAGAERARTASRRQETGIPFFGIML
jgi:hypothetical protein